MAAGRSAPVPAAAARQLAVVLGDAVTTGGATLVACVLGCFAFPQHSYAGVAPSAAPSLTAAPALFSPRDLGCIGGCFAIEILFVCVGTLGAWAALPIRRLPAPTQRWCVRALSAFYAAAYIGSLAALHPGPFLTWLTSSEILAESVLFFRIAGPWVWLLSIAGLLHFAWRGVTERRLWQIGFALVSSAFLGLGFASGLAGRTLTADLGRPRAESRPRATSAERGPDVILIAADSVRPDYLNPETTPAISALLAQSVYFPNTLVAQPRTSTSWATLLTSLDPLEHGIEVMFPDPQRAKMQTMALPAHLAESGYDTAVVAEYAGEHFTRIDFGFRDVHAPQVGAMDIARELALSDQPILLAPLLHAFGASPLSSNLLLSKPVRDVFRGMASYSDGPSLIRQVEHYIDTRPSDRPFFLTVFLSQPHFPYTSSNPYYADSRVAGTPPTRAFGHYVTTDMDPKEVDQVRALYRGALRETDATVGTLLRTLQARHILDHSLVVFTSDHGEGLFDCPRCVGHGDNLDTLVTLKVPLGFRLPSGRHSVEDEWVSQLDVYPTLLSLLQKAPVATHEGFRLLDAAGNLVRPPRERTFFFETGEWLWPTAAVPSDRIDYPSLEGLLTEDDGVLTIDPRYLPTIRAAKYRGVFAPPWKLLYEPGRSAVRYQLFDTAADPLEREDLAETHPEEVRRLRDALRRHVARNSSILAVGDYFLTEPRRPPEDSLGHDAPAELP